MRLLTRTYSSNYDYDGDCTYAVIDIDDVCREAILSRRELLQMVASKDSAIDTLRFLDSSVFYYHTVDELIHLLLDGPLNEDELSDSLDDGNIFSLKEGVELPSNEQPTDCGRLVIESDVFYWHCYPKHTTVSIETETISYDRLRVGE